MSEETTARPPPGGVPPAFVVAIAFMLIVGIGLGLLATYASTTMDPSSSGGWLNQFLSHGIGLVWTGVSIATTTLMLVGFAELVRRGGPSVDGHLLRVGIVAMVVMLGLALAGLYMRFWWQPRGEWSAERVRTLDEFWMWRQRLSFAAALVASASLIAAGRRIPVVLAVALPLLVLTAFQFPTRWVDELITYDQPSGDAQLWTQLVIDLWIRVGFCGAFMATASAVGASLPPARSDMVRAGQGLERVGSALVATVLVLLVAVFTLVMTVGAQSPSMARVAGVIFPACLLLASIALVTGMLQAASLSGVGAPRLRLYTAAALSLTALAINALKAISLYVLLRRGGDLDSSASEQIIKRTVGALPYLVPSVSIAGLLCLLSAAERLRRMAPGARVDAAGINAAAASVTIFSAAGVGLLHWAQTGVGSRGEFILASILVAVANIIAQLAVARVCHRVGAAMREVAALPTAVATVK